MAPTGPDGPPQTSKPLTASQPLTRATLLTKPAVAVLGQLAAQQLFEFGHACFWINNEGQVELVPLLELQLDTTTEPEALQTLIQAGYGDEQLRSYLQRRDARLVGASK